MLYLEDKDVFILYFDEEINRNFDPEKDKEFEKDLKDDEKTVILCEINSIYLRVILNLLFIIVHIFNTF